MRSLGDIIRQNALLKEQAPPVARNPQPGSGGKEPPKVPPVKTTHPGEEEE